MRSSARSFKLAMIVLILFVIALVGVFISGNGSSDSSALMIGLPLFAAGVISLIGCWHSIKSFKDPRSGRKYIGITVNFGYAMLLMALIVANIVDIARALRT